ncbi:MAG: phosphatidate cytidylyltransferase [Acholeplasmatales bacterium]|nr:phosphatidate cytidylyltransferase [Acholeplasmatales bacterium]
MKKRIITAVVMGIVLIPLLLIEVLLPVFELLVIALGTIATFELVNMYDKQKKIAMPMKILTVVLTMVLYASIVNSFSICDKSLICKFLDIINVSAIFTPVIALFAIFIILMSCLVFVPDFEVQDIGKLYLAIIYVGVCVGAFLTLRYYGVRFVIYLLLVSMSTDIFALVFGLSFGKHKMAPNISPKKTWEGAIGGTATALVIGFCFLFFYKNMSPTFHDGQSLEFFDTVFNYKDFSTPGKVFFVIILTIALSACSQIGDLVASKLKRCYGIKDYSNLFPGHGGVLDRFDSTFFASAIFLLFMIAESNIFPWIG